MKTKVILGRICFWVGWPGLWLIFRLSNRTRVLIVCGGEFLAVRSWLGSGDWGLPGGGLHRGEDPAVGAIREVSEEVGLSIDGKQLSIIYEGRIYSKALSYNAVIFGVVLDSKPKLTPQRLEIRDAKWVSIDDIQLTLNLPTDILSAIKQWQKSRACDTISDNGQGF